MGAVKMAGPSTTATFGDSTFSDTVSTSGVQVALPLTSAGRKAAEVLISTDTPVFVRPTQNAQTYLNTAMHRMNVEDGPLRLDTKGFTHVYFIAVSGTTKVRVTPLEV